MGTCTLTSYTDDSDDVTPSCPGGPDVVAKGGTLSTSASMGGSELTSLTLTVGGTLVDADLGGIDVYYDGVLAGTAAEPEAGNPVTVPLPGTQRGGQPLRVELRLRPSSAGKTYSVTVSAVAGAQDPSSLLPATTVSHDIDTPTCE